MHPLTTLHHDTVEPYPAEAYQLLHERPRQVRTLCRHQPVDPLALLCGRHRESSGPGHLIWGRTEAVRIMRATPVTMQLSARLKTGHQRRSTKSTTYPRRIRSVRLPSAPPSTRPSPIRSQMGPCERRRYITNRPAMMITAMTTNNTVWLGNRPKAAPLLCTTSMSTAPPKTDTG